MDTRVPKILKCILVQNDAIWYQAIKFWLLVTKSGHLVLVARWMGAFSICHDMHASITLANNLSLVLEQTSIVRLTLTPEPLTIIDI